MYKRIVIKVGTKVLSREDGRIDLAALEGLVRQIAEDARETAGKKGGRSIVHYDYLFIE